MNVHPIRVLLIEDNEADRELTIIALERGKIKVSLDCVNDGEEAVEYLKRRGPFAGKEMPDIIFLDWNMPRMNGREVLQFIRGDEDLKLLPVVVLTTSSSESDIIKSYELHANSFVTKPVDIDELKKVVAAITDFWFTVVRLPPR